MEMTKADDFQGKVHRLIRNRISRKLKRFLQPILTVSLFLLPLLVIVLWLTFQYKPTWYRPAQLDAMAIQQARNSALTRIDDVSRQMVQGRGFDVVLTEEEVNAWLAVLPTSWPNAMEKLPEGISQPVVRFVNGGLWVGAHYTARGWQTIVSFEIALQMEPAEDRLRVTLRHVKLGAISVPLSMLDSVFTDLIRSSSVLPVQENRRRKGVSASVDRSIHSAPTAQGVSIRNRFVWFNGKRPFRIESLTLTPKQLKLHLQPLKGGR